MCARRAALTVDVVLLTLCLHAGLLLLNMVISIISEGLAEILDDDLKNEGAPTMFDHLVRTAAASYIFLAQLCIPNVILQEEIKFFAQMKKALGMELKTESVFNALENIDEDGDKLISQEEIVAFCTKNPDALEVLGVSSVKELYDFPTVVKTSCSSPCRPFLSECSNSTRMAVARCPQANAARLELHFCFVSEPCAAGRGRAEPAARVR